ncbi:hypothetical protein AAFF_G00306490 [Aldrovandia affinis]|uniref:Uncharacterized protein n=1 Tax=Aldrovandia affinis TaxID=143900 RepID=A0AAD7SPU7_9TELE|nr:hypothetical protein AAFF_G00306490 [Aldrovandia affinis]
MNAEEQDRLNRPKATVNHNGRDRQWSLSLPVPDTRSYSTAVLSTSLGWLAENCKPRHPRRSPRRAPHDDSENENLPCRARFVIIQSARDGTLVIIRPLFPLIYKCWQGEAAATAHWGPLGGQKGTVW